MPVDENLIAFFESETARPAPPIDLGAVLRRSTRRHRTRQAVTGGATALAVIGIGAAGLTGIRASLGGNGTVSAVSDSNAGVPATGESPKRAPAERINLCGAPIAQVAPAASGLVLSVQFAATAFVGAESIRGTVTMTNTGTKRLTGSTAPSPAITLSQRGVTLWHSNGPTIMMAAMVDLAPGASMTYPAMFVPVRCTAQDDSQAGFPANLPRVPAGEYQLSSAIDFSPDGGTVELVTGPAAGIRLG